MVRRIAACGRALSCWLALLACLAAGGAHGDAAANPQPVPASHDPGLRARYAAALQAAILRQWVQPPGAKADASCLLEILQAPGGAVVSVRTTERCGFDARGRAAVEAAVRKASPLPYDGYEGVFVRHLLLHFRAVAGAKPDPRAP